MSAKLQFGSIVTVAAFAILVLGSMAAWAAMPAQNQQPNEVQVELIAYEIRMPAQLPPGPTEFVVTNIGELPHNFEIEGQGIEREFEEDLQAGETRTMQVDLQPGEYRVYCPVGNHAERGMEMTLTVTEQ